VADGDAELGGYVGQDQTGQPQPVDRYQAMTGKVEPWVLLEVIHEVELGLRAQLPEQVAQK
jgi:hypothetical protein